MAPRFACRTPNTASAFLIGPRERLATISIARTAVIPTLGGGSCRSNVELFAARKFATNGSIEGAPTVRAAWVDEVGNAVTTDGGAMLWHELATKASPKAKQVVQVRAGIALY